MQNDTLTVHVEFALRNYIREALADFDEESTDNINQEIEKAAQKAAFFILNLVIGVQRLLVQAHIQNLLQPMK